MTKDYIDIVRENNRIYLKVKIELASDEPILEEHIEFSDRLKARFAKPA